MPASSRIVEAVEEFTCVVATSSKQHVELRECCQNRDTIDVQCFIDWFREHNPFKTTSQLSSLFTGVMGDENVNCDKALEAGIVAIKELEGKSFSDIHLKW